LGTYQSRTLEIFRAPDIGTFEYEQSRAERDPSPIWMMRRPLIWVKLFLHRLEGRAMGTSPDNMCEAADSMERLTIVPEPRQ
jgi:hypothetical protein